MLICSSCKKEFPIWMVIDGKKRCLNKRKYCIECSPFNAHNTRDISGRYQPLKGTIRTCKYCKKEYSYDREKGRVGFVCASCNANLRRYRLKQELIKYKGGKCQNCGYDKYVAALVFHHNDPSEKDFTLSRCISKGIKRLKEEADKCTLLCSNCHAAYHVENDYKYATFGFDKFVTKDSE